LSLCENISIRTIKITRKWGRWKKRKVGLGSRNTLYCWDGL